MIEGVRVRRKGQRERRPGPSCLFGYVGTGSLLIANASGVEDRPIKSEHE